MDERTNHVRNTSPIIPRQPSPIRIVTRNESSTKIIPMISSIKPGRLSAKSYPAGTYPDTLHSKRGASIDNHGPAKILTGATGGTVSTAGTNDLVENTHRMIKKLSMVPSVHGASGSRSLSRAHLMERALKQVEEYRDRARLHLIEQLSNSQQPSAMFNLTNDLNQNDSLKFPERPATPIELAGRSNKYDIATLMANATIDKSDETNTLVGRYEISHSISPTLDLPMSHIGVRHDKSIGDLHSSLRLFEGNEEHQWFLTRLLETYFDGELYDRFKAKCNTLSLAQQLNDVFKGIYYRYRTVVQVFVGQHLDQSILIASRSLWDKSVDGFFEKRFSKGTIFAVLLVFFIYKQ